MRPTKCDLPNRYRYNARQYSQFGRWHYTYEVVGEYGAVHLHLNKYKDDTENSGGVEVHYLKRPDYMESQPPHHDECPLLKLPCWHDGSSLAAEEYVWMHEQGDVEAIFARLVHVADDRFGDQSEHKTTLQKLSEACVGSERA